MSTVPATKTKKHRTKKSRPPSAGKPKKSRKAKRRAQEKTGVGAPPTRASPEAREQPPEEAGRVMLITRPPIKRILKRAGCTRISRDVFEVVYQQLYDYTEKILLSTAVVTDHAPRSTIQVSDLNSGFKAHGQLLALAPATKKKPPASKTDNAPPKARKRAGLSGFEIPLNNFKKLCKTIVTSNDLKQFRFSEPVVKIFQSAVEIYVHDVAALALKCAEHAGKRQTVKAADFRLALAIRGW
uniref:Histone-like protein n=1 Tax=Marseillevirus LCMAC103 TaxID=2506604 RepID=A0A481YU79_9VIRU|nr:MAG: histone-like protein [Marseillevirus LCMAC103]